MKFLQKLILPILAVGVVLVIYVMYFMPSDELGSFSIFDPNNSASKEIRVELVSARGISMDEQAGSSIFYARDKEGTIVMVHGPLNLPKNTATVKTLMLTGHLHQDYFHAASVKTD